MIHINDRLAIGEDEIEETFVRASGPGGQNVHKVSTAVQLRFDARRSPSLSSEIRDRLEVLAGHLLTREGVVVITAQRFRTQERNRKDAIERLVDLIRQATVRRRARRATKPTLGSQRRRAEAKSQRSQTKQSRGYRPED